MQNLKEHHWAWLSKRPERSPEWLSVKLSEGFDIHHIDGDHYNNAPDNLVLIDREDHGEIHGRPVFPRRVASGNIERRLEKFRMGVESGRKRFRTEGRFDQETMTWTKQHIAGDEETIKKTLSTMTDSEISALRGVGPVRRGMILEWLGR